MDYVLDETSPIEKNFEAICRVPHGSFHEQKISDFLTEFAKNHGLKYHQQSCGNVIIYKDGTEGYEDHAPVMLQGHMDMVCEAVPGCTHNFEEDPLDLYVEDGLIMARGTSLGADDGVGVAYMMSILESRTLKHPPLECVFTVQEEVGCMGAAELDMSLLKSERMIGLDDIGGNSTTICAAGIETAELSFSAPRKASDKAFFALKIEGLIGGHSGDQIHLERANANNLAARVMNAVVMAGYQPEIGSIQGGTKTNSIPRSCTVVFVANGTKAELESSIARIIAEIEDEYHYSDPNIQITVEDAAAVDVYDAETSKDLIEYLYLLPTSLQHRSRNIEGLTTASANLAVLTTDEQGAHMTYSMRGAVDSLVDTLENKLHMLSARYGWVIDSANRSECWPYNETSALRGVLSETFHQVTGRDLELCAEHGGLECGAFSQMRPSMDIVTIGPKVRGYHTTEEYLDRASFAEIYGVLTAVLEKL